MDLPESAAPTIPRRGGAAAVPAFAASPQKTARTAIGRVGTGLSNKKGDPKAALS
jgi:hypothetical protein